MATTSHTVSEALVARRPGNAPGALDRALSTVAGKLLLPSLSDLFFVALIIWLFVAGGDGWKGLLLDGDCGWHIRTGETILDKHAVPYVDPYSFTKGGEPWYAWEWLSDVLLAVLYRWAGLKGVVLAAGTVIAAYATVLLRRIFAQGANLFVALFVALLSVGAASIHFLARPHIFTLLFLAVALWMVEADRARPGWRIWLLVPLTALWTNMHGGFLALIACLGCLAAGTAVEALLGSGAGWKPVLRYTGLAAASMAASLVNPYGVQLHVHIGAYLRSDWIKNVIQEFQSPSFRSENILQFEALMFIGLIVAADCLRRKQVVEALWIVAFAHFALGSVRHVPVFVTIAAPVIARTLSEWWSRWSQSLPAKSAAALIEQMGRDLAPGFRRNTVWPCAVVAVFALMGERMNWPEDFPSLTFPTRMVKAHPELLIGHRVFSYDQWGDYLIFNDPARKVFIDGRSDFYGPELGDEYLAAFQGQWKWREVLDRHRIDVVLAPVSWPLVSILKQTPEWKLVSDDGQAALFRRETGTSVAAVRGD